MPGGAPCSHITLAWGENQASAALLSVIRQHCFSVPWSSWFPVGSSTPSQLPWAAGPCLSPLNHNHQSLHSLGSYSGSSALSAPVSLFPQTPHPHLHGRHRERQAEVQKSLNSFKAAISGSSCFLAYAELHDALGSFLFLTLPAVPPGLWSRTPYVPWLKSSLPGSSFTPRFSPPGLVPCLLSPPGSFLVSLLRRGWFFAHLWASLNSTFTLN